MGRVRCYDGSPGSISCDVLKSLGFEYLPPTPYRASDRCTSLDQHGGHKRRLLTFCNEDRVGIAHG